MQELPAFPDAELVVMALLADLATVVTSTPEGIAGPLVRVARIGGTDDGVTDYARVEVLCYHTTRPLSQVLATACRVRISAAGGTAAGGVLIDRAYPDVAPTHESYRNPDVRAVPGIYRFEWRRPT